MQTADGGRLSILGPLQPAVGGGYVDAKGQLLTKEEVWNLARLTTEGATEIQYRKFYAVTTLGLLTASAWLSLDALQEMKAGDYYDYDDSADAKLMAGLVILSVDCLFIMGARQPDVIGVVNDHLYYTGGGR